ncbi:hypothetical protein [Aporhodopirellula aestuarii]|uniref:Secreted protein n=1 Tax=Aporhodopirellula aestuarii TaxID=2950107 RepID=A0ABT0TYR1_9BACT|nr:hypothetical protein [Aporhodopirellula aestuarii]MCM2369733.1 hypothetical protein [Aporhodopirellula aestuarii]
MKNLLMLLLVFVGCSFMSGCGGDEPTVATENLTEADLEAYEAENRRLEEETASGG